MTNCPYRKIYWLNIKMTFRAVFNVWYLSVICISLYKMIRNIKSATKIWIHVLFHFLSLYIHFSKTCQILTNQQIFSCCKSDKYLLECYNCLQTLWFRQCFFSCSTKQFWFFFFLPKRLTDCHLSFKFQAFNEVLSYVFNSLHFAAQLLFFCCCLLFCESKPNSITMLFVVASRQHCLNILLMF